MTPLRILVNPLNSWLMLLPMGQLYRTTSAALKKRMNNPGAYGDILSHWLDAQKKSDRLSFREIEAQANVNVGAGAEPVSCAYPPALFCLVLTMANSRGSERYLSHDPTSRSMAKGPQGD